MKHYLAFGRTILGAVAMFLATSAFAIPFETKTDGVTLIPLTYVQPVSTSLAQENTEQVRRIFNHLNQISSCPVNLSQMQPEDAVIVSGEIFVLLSGGWLLARESVGAFHNFIRLVVATGVEKGALETIRAEKSVPLTMPVNGATTTHQLLRQIAAAQPPVKKEAAKMVLGNVGRSMGIAAVVVVSVLVLEHVSGELAIDRSELLAKYGQIKTWSNLAETEKLDFVARSIISLHLDDDKVKAINTPSQWKEFLAGESETVRAWLSQFESDVENLRSRLQAYGDPACFVDLQ